MPRVLEGQMILHRLYLGGDNARAGERADQVKVAHVVARFFQEFTMLPGIGYWEGCREESWIIEVASDDSEKVRACARALALAFNQDAVGVAEVGTFSLVK